MTSTKTYRIHKYVVSMLLTAASLEPLGCVDPRADEPAPEQDQGHTRPAMDLGMPPQPEDMRTNPDMHTEHDQDMTESTGDMSADMLGEDLGLTEEPCEHEIANIYWMIQEVQAIDADGMDLRDTAIAPADDEGTVRFSGIVRERHESTHGTPRRWFNLDATGDGDSTPHVRLMLREWEEHPLPDFNVGDELLIERNARVANCGLPNDAGGVTTLLFTTIKDATSGELLHAEGDALLDAAGGVDLPAIAPIPSTRWRWRTSQECNSQPPPLANVFIETESGQIITPGREDVEEYGFVLFTFRLLGHYDPQPGMCGLWQFYITPLQPNE